MSIKTKLLLAIIGVLAVTGVLMGGIIYWQNNQKLAEHAYTDIKSTIDYTYQLVNFSFNRAEDNLINLANNQIIIQAIETKNPQKLAQASDVMQTTAETIGVIKNIALEEVNGLTCIVRSGDKSVLPVVGKDPSSRDYCGGIIETKAPYIASAVISASTGQFILPIAVPVKNSAGEVVGLLVAALDITELRGYLWDLQTDSSVVLFDRSGVPFLDTTKQINKLDIPLTAVENKVKEGLAENKNEQYFQDQDRFVGYKSDGVITVVYEKSAKDEFAFAYTLNITLVSGLLVMIVLVVFIIYFFINSITDRISRLSLITQKIAGGQFEINLDKDDLTAKDETAVLARAFNDMAMKISDMYKTMDNKVQERTIDLERSKNELERMNSFMVDRELKLAEMKKETHETQK